MVETNYQLVAYYRILKNWTGELGQFFTPSKGHYVCLSYLLQVEGMCSNKLGCVLTHTHTRARTYTDSHILERTLSLSLSLSFFRICTQGTTQKQYW